ncbi:hypothetical protein QIS99_28805 [Streptomyces sp. B-S-A8]|uniref:Uncharacterized protein n=1 Tax=Streptomyces solicavernae TaxID=3043614 RepID=A0ABT6S2L8_9ACTN|nr:hypothetical protein [Streptomyces sp. B-S-A8]MDI3390161.1 hypothetical protein [Streptomyces sp. B-S-A8]
MTTSRSYHVHVVLSAGGLWQGSVKELPEVTDSHRSLSSLETRLRRKISAAAGISEDDVAIESDITTGNKKLDERLAEARELRRQADDLNSRARQAAAPLANTLVSKGVSQRDVGTLLSVSGALVNSMLKKT